MPLRASQTDEEYGTWRAEGHALTIEYSHMVLEELRLAAEEGFQKIPHGGLEVGALLLGRHEGDRVRIEEWRPLECEHGRGPGFVLSPNDLAALDRLIRDCADAPELRELYPVGWFHTHTRSNIFFSPEDKAVHDRFFREPWHVAMVMRLGKDQPATAGFFFREANGAMQMLASYKEFVVRPNASMLLRPPRATAAPRPEPEFRKAVPAPERPRAPERRTWWDTPPAEPRMVADPGAGATPALEPLPENLTDLPEGRFRWRLFAMVVVLLLAIAAAVMTRPYWMGESAPSLTLRLEEVEDQLIIRWDHNSKAAREADRGVLQVIDGGQTRELALDTLEARNGSLTIVRQSEDVQVKLTLYSSGNKPVQEYARFLGGPVKPKGAAQPGEQPGVSADIERIKQALEQEASRSERLRETVRNLEERLKQR
jgi:hypothetical protein